MKCVAPTGSVPVCWAIPIKPFCQGIYPESIVTNSKLHVFMHLYRSVLVCVSIYIYTHTHIHTHTHTYAHTHTHICTWERERERKQWPLRTFPNLQQHQMGLYLCIRALLLDKLFMRYFMSSVWRNHFSSGNQKLISKSAFIIGNYCYSVSKK